MTDKPWETEPDELDFEHAGFPCCIRRTPELGSLCGYVTVPEGHPWFGAGDALDVDVHGGITYAHPEGADWRLGFDCAHCGDMTPGVLALLGREPRPGETYRDIAYVRGEVEHLAEQARAAVVRVEG